MGLGLGYGRGRTWGAIVWRVQSKCSAVAVAVECEGEVSCLEILGTDEQEGEDTGLEEM